MHYMQSLWLGKRLHLRLHVYLGEVQLEDETKLGQTAQQVVGMVSQVEPFGCMRPVLARGDWKIFPQSCGKCG